MSREPQQSDFRKALDHISRNGHDNRKVFDAFVLFAACALATGTRETEYAEEAKRWSAEEMACFATAFGALVLEMESRPFEDVLGTYYMDWALSHASAQRGGEFHTPREVCLLMAKMTFGDGSDLPKDRPITVCEPCSGGGAMILALGEVVPPDVRRRLRVTAIDVNRTACHMTFINTSLWGIPCRVYHGNTLANEYHAAWSNIHFICPWLPLAMRLGTDEAKSQGQPPAEGEAQRVSAAVGTGQDAFDFFDVSTKEGAAA